jgi:hypothetical protein
MLGNDSLGHGLAHDLVTAVAEHSLGSRIELDDPAFVIDRDDAVERQLDDRRTANIIRSASDAFASWMMQNVTVLLIPVWRSLARFSASFGPHIHGLSPLFMTVMARVSRLESESGSEDR